MSENVKIIPGVGATAGVGSDCYPFTVHKVSENGKTLWASEDSHEPAEGFEYYGNQVYNYSNVNANNPAAWSKFTLRKDGKWHRGTTMNGQVLYVGNRRYYQNPSF